MTSTIDESPEWRRQTRVERAIREPSDPDDAAYFRLYRRLEEPLPVALPTDLADRVIRRRTRAKHWGRLLWVVITVLSVGVGIHGISLSLFSLSRTTSAPMALMPEIEWPLVGFAVLALVAGVWWAGRRHRVA